LEKIEPDLLRGIPREREELFIELRRSLRRNHYAFVVFDSMKCELDEKGVRKITSFKKIAANRF